MNEGPENVACSDESVREEMPERPNARVRTSLFLSSHRPGLISRICVHAGHQHRDDDDQRDLCEVGNCQTR